MVCMGWWCQPYLCLHDLHDHNKPRTQPKEQELGPRHALAAQPQEGMLLTGAAAAAHG